MRKRTSRRQVNPWLLGLVMLMGAAGRAQDADAGMGTAPASVYVQGSEVNLRGSASTTGEVVKKVSIGTECQRLGAVDKKGWVRLKCADAEGFTLDKLVGPDKPSLDALLAQAQDATKSAKERLDAAARAATLDPQNESASKLLTSLFFDVNFEQLAKEQKKGGLHESFIAWCNYARQPPRRTHEQCLTDELEKIEYDWHQVRIRDDHFVSAMFREGSLFVLTGHTKPRAKGRFVAGDDEIAITIESRGQSAISDALKASLQKDARPSAPAREKYDGVNAEYAGMPVLSPEAYRLLRSLPSLWYHLQEQSGERYILVNGGSIAVTMFEVDLYRRANLKTGDLPQDQDVPRADRIKDISKTDSGYKIEVCYSEVCQGSEAAWVTLMWPTGEPGVAQWITEGQDADGRKGSSTSYMSVNKGAPNQVRRQ